jgi:hypothetical protein
MMTLFFSGILVGVVTTWLLVRHVIKELLNEINELKDFELWKEWKNK